MHPRFAMMLAVVAALTLWMSTATPASAGYYPPAHSDAAYFHDSLAPYGTWTHHASYGAVWYPRGMSHGWRPYTQGRWVWDDGYGWTWASGFAWGWAPFHYGSWIWDAAFGWIWVPGRVWAPAWVTWRYSDSYIGWAPIGYGVSWRSYNPGWSYGGWNYVHRQHFGAPVVHQHIIVVNNYKTIYHNTHHWAPPRNKHNRVEHRGFDRGFVERGSRYKIDRVHARPEHWQRNDHRQGPAGRDDWRNNRQDGVRYVAPERRVEGRPDSQRDPQWSERQDGQHVRPVDNRRDSRQPDRQQHMQEWQQIQQQQRLPHQGQVPQRQAQQPQRQEQQRSRQAMDQQRQQQMQQQQRLPHQGQVPQRQAQQPQRQEQQRSRQAMGQQMEQQQSRPPQGQVPQRQAQQPQRQPQVQEQRAPEAQRQPQQRYEQRVERRDESRDGGRDGGRTWR
ncbi:DUF6600 domain-containing protein [Parvibaculum sp.]|uniref:DUF6600 domain-containing protein n=1 Tax=Parvibaculum sp. TaxID=2024848 RepID=UPI00272B9694|nr:DUF6600 domain-containing protein [Parvibaculum sp.]